MAPICERNPERWHLVHTHTSRCACVEILWRVCYWCAVKTLQANGLVLIVGAPRFRAPREDGRYHRPCELVFGVNTVERVDCETTVYLADGKQYTYAFPLHGTAYESIAYTMRLNAHVWDGPDDLYGGVLWNYSTRATVFLKTLWPN